jgi:hypothetical protein
MNNIPTPRIDNAFKNPPHKYPRMNATLDSVYEEGKKLERDLAAAERERDELYDKLFEAVMKINQMQIEWKESRK